MNPDLLQKLERLLAAQIEIVPFDAITNHFVMARGGFVALVEKRTASFGSIGSGGIMTEKGFACLVWRGTDAFFVAKNFEQQATAEQISGLRQFDAELRQALQS